MNDPHEIIVTLRENPTEPRVVQFSELYPLKDEILTMVHLWNANSYYVNVASRTFIINGGRKLIMEKLGEECSLISRRRNQFEVGMNTPEGDGGQKNKKINWIIGIEDADNNMVLVQIAEDGHAWVWLDKL